MQKCVLVAVLVSMFSVAFGAQDSIETVVNSVLGNQRDGTLQASGQFCTAMSQVSELNGEDLLSFSYWYAAADGAIVGHTKSYSPKDRSWQIDSEKYLIAVQQSSAPTERMELKYNEEFQLTAVRINT